MSLSCTRSEILSLFLVTIYSPKIKELLCGQIDTQTCTHTCADQLLYLDHVSDSWLHHLSQSWCYYV